MKKRIWSILLVLLLSGILAGCGILDMKRNAQENMVDECEDEKEAQEDSVEEESVKDSADLDTDKKYPEDQNEDKNASEDDEENQKDADEEQDKEETGEETSELAEDDFSDIHLDLDDLGYSNKREDFPSDVAFANFRHLSGGAINESMFYRSVSPIFNQYGRAAYADAFAREVGIKSVLNLSDNKTEIQTYLDESGHISPYYEQLLGENRVLALDLSSNYHKNSFAFALAEGLRKMMSMEGPVLIHCIEGKDRTGFVCLLLEGLAGASYDEVVADYMVTFDNYLGINQENNPRYYRYIKQEEVDSVIRYIALEDDDVDASTIDIHKAARQYLYNAGLTEEELDKLEERVKQ